MKKILLLAMCAGLFSATTEAQVLKQESGDKNLEVNFTPLGGSPISIGGIKFRKFSSATSAFRLNVFLGSNSKKDITQQEDAPNYDAELTTKTSGMNISIRPGIEKHMAGTDRLSPYCGAEIAITLNTSKEVKEGQNQATPTDITINKTTTKGKDGYIAFGLNLLAGVDYYIAKSLYMGAEIGFGFNMQNDSKIKVEYSGFPTATTNPNDAKQGSNFQFGPTFISAIRLGWLFK